MKFRDPRAHQAAAVAGAGTAFSLNALSFLGVLWVIVRWKGGGNGEVVRRGR